MVIYYLGVLLLTLILSTLGYKYIFKPMIVQAKKEELLTPIKEAKDKIDIMNEVKSDLNYVDRRIDNAIEQQKRINKLNR